MVQKSFYALVLQDCEINPKDHPEELVNALRANGFKNDKISTDLMAKVYGNEWQDKCNRSLLLAKQLGNTYTGSLYNGLLSLICDETIDLTNKRVFMFSYGSGCAASLYSITCT